MTKFLYILLATLLLAGTLVFYSFVSASDSGALSPGTMANDATVGDIEWIDPNNSKVSDGNYTTISQSGDYNLISNGLKATNFGFSIPLDATITGIVLEIEKSATVSTAFDYSVDYRVYIIKDGIVGTTNKGSMVTWWPTSDTYVTHGSSTDLWGETWTPADINSSTFGGYLRARLSTDTGITAKVDHIRMTVYYTIGTPVVTFKSQTSIINGNMIIK